MCLTTKLVFAKSMDCGKKGARGGQCNSEEAKVTLKLTHGTD